MVQEAGRVGPYVLGGLLGEGAMGKVWRAQDTEMDGREVALKLLHEPAALGSPLLRRFQREARSASKLRNPHVVPIHRYGDIDGRPYIDMQLVEGRDLAAVLRDDGPLAPDRAADILAQVAEALTAAHFAGLVHRDVKPSNILVTPTGFTYLVDFGIARALDEAPERTAVTSTGVTVGTVAYMAPEQARALQNVDGRADVYALTCVLFEMLTGRQPFPYVNVLHLFTAHHAESPPRVTDLRGDLSTRWDDVVARGMAKDPDRRHPTPDALARAVRWALEGPVPARRPPLPRPDDRPPAEPRTQNLEQPVARARGRRTRAWIGVPLVLLLAAGAVVWLVNGGLGQGTPATALPGDLGLTVPVSSPPCEGTYAVFIAAAVEPSTYAQVIQFHLDQYPGSSYLYGPESCPSTAKFRDGTPIYSVYLGPFATADEACAVRGGALPDDAFVRRLDRVTPIGQTVPCSS